MLDKILRQHKPFLDCVETDEYLRIVSEDHTGKGEVHHILPETLYPEYRNETWNKVNLSYRNHYRVHELLPFMLEGKQKGSMLYAWNMMRGRTGEDFVDADRYDELRRLHSERASEQMKENQPMHRPEVVAKLVGRKRPEHGLLMSENNPATRDDVKIKLSANNNMKTPEGRLRFTGENNPNFGKQMSDEQKQCLRSAKLGTVVDYDVKKKISKSMIGKTTTGVIIDGVIYNSVTSAAKELSVDRHTIAKWVKSGKAAKLCQQKTLVVIGCIKYDSMSEAARSIGISRAAIRSMIKHGKAIKLDNHKNSDKLPETKGV
jgi:hypothetical protein